MKKREHDTGVDEHRTPEAPEIAESADIAGGNAGPDAAADPDRSAEGAPSESEVEVEEDRASRPVPRSASLRQILTIAGLVLMALIIGTRFGDSLSAGVDHVWDTVAGSSEEGEGHAHDGQWYTCGMHPWVLLPEPGLCPICNMDLTPVDPAKFSGEVSIDPIVTQNIGIRIAEVETGGVGSGIRTVGSIEYDESRVRDVNTKFAGWIEKLYVDREGAEVRAGEPLFGIYSPELYAAQEEYLLARRSGLGATITAAARNKLANYDVGAAEIKALERRGKATRALTIRSPHTGIVIEKHANEGMKVDPGTKAFRIADISKVWVIVTLYEYQLPQVKVGQRATMTLPYLPGEVFEGEVSYVYPYLDKKTRQVDVRVEFENPDLKLKPGMYATVELASENAGGERVLAPREAVIDTGERKVAFVSLGEGRFEPRDVKTGVEGRDGRIEILEGLEPGEMVVTSGQFLLDSEAKMREALAKMIAGDQASEQKPEVMVAETGDVQLPDSAKQALTRILDGYFAMQDELASDGAAGVAVKAKELAEQLAALTSTDIPGSPHFWHENAEAAEAREAALALADGETDLDAVRPMFLTLSEALVKVVRATGVPDGYERGVLQLHCPMYASEKGGANWLQPEGPVRNPYYGSMMLGCYDTREALSTVPQSG